MQYNKLNIITGIFFLLSITCSAQKNNKSVLTGKVINIEKNSVPFADVYIKTLAIGTTTDKNGNYILKNIPEGTYLITVSSLGYSIQKKRTTVKNNIQNTINFSLKEQANNLEEVVVAAKSKTSKVKEQPYTVTSIDVRPLKVLNLDINQILNSTTGIRIRETGGMGSDFNFSLNGFSGNQIKFFIDGIPMDNFGSSLTLNNIPSNQISRIEVYKGVVPIHLGADALGGAVNVITETAKKSFLDLSYTLGTFNTHRVSVLGKYLNEKSGFTLNANAFYNSSDNNYKIDIENEGERGIIDGTIEVERFHDAYQSQTIHLDGGFVNKSYADRISLGVTASSNKKEIQHAYDQKQPFGEVFKTDKVIISTFKYQKKNFFTKKLNTNIYATYSINESTKNDTSSKIYDWFGNYILNPVEYKGEYGYDKTEYTFTDKSANAGTSFVFKVNKNHSFSFNNTFSNVSRIGADPYERSSVVTYSHPHYLTKNITGLSYNLNLLDGKWKTNLFGKYFLMASKGYKTEWNSEDFVRTLLTINSDHSLNGYGIATTYFFNKDIQVKSSYENTYRLPTSAEMFGDGVDIIPNLELEPEKSKNVNIAILAKKNFHKHNVQVDFGYLYRDTDNFIRSRIASRFKKQFVNLLKGKTNSFEGTIKYNYNNKFNFEVNGTYLNIISANEFDVNGGVSPLYLDRLPNIPFLFGNASIGYRHKDFLKENNHLSFNFSSHFVEAFYLNWPSQGSEGKFDIPQQISHDISLSYSLNSGKYNISFGATNITDEILYDDYKLQKPGRSFSIKINYFLQ